MFLCDDMLDRGETLLSINESVHTSYSIPNDNVRVLSRKESSPEWGRTALTFSDEWIFTSLGF